jgi:hypothetical protein
MSIPNTRKRFEWNLEWGWGTRTHGGGGGGLVGAGNPLWWALELTNGETNPHRKGIKLIPNSL